MRQNKILKITIKNLLSNPLLQNPFPNLIKEQKLTLLNPKTHLIKLDLTKTQTTLPKRLITMGRKEQNRLIKFRNFLRKILKITLQSFNKTQLKLLILLRKHFVQNHVTFTVYHTGQLLVQLLVNILGRKFLLLKIISKKKETFEARNNQTFRLDSESTEG